SSRRRHTRFSRDWSSDVCSSDLFAAAASGGPAHGHAYRGNAAAAGGTDRRSSPSSAGRRASAGGLARERKTEMPPPNAGRPSDRSEERRVGEKRERRVYTSAQIK